MYSHSRINCFKQCPKMYEYKYIRRLNPIEESSSLFIGSGFHKCIELNDVNAALKWMDEESEKNINTISDSVETDKIIAAAMGEAFLKKYPDHNKGNVKHEVHFVHKLPNGEEFQLYLDGLVETDEGYYIREYKTSSRVDETYIDKLKFNDQISRYWCIIEKELDKPILGVDYYVAKKPLLRQKKTESLEQYRERLVERLMEDDNIINIKLTRTREEIDEAYQDLIYDIDVINKATRYTKVLSSCTAYGRCPYMDLCMGNEDALVNFIEKEEDNNDITRK